MTLTGNPDGEDRFLGFEHGLPSLMKWMALKVWSLPAIGSLDTAADLFGCLMPIMITVSFLHLHSHVLDQILKCLT